MKLALYVKTHVGENCSGMSFYSRCNREQSEQTDRVYVVISKIRSVTLGDGTLTRETQSDARSILAAIELLLEEGKIRITADPPREFVLLPK